MAPLRELAGDEDDGLLGAAEAAGRAAAGAVAIAAKSSAAQIEAAVARAAVYVEARPLLGTAVEAGLILTLFAIFRKLSTTIDRFDDK